MVRIVRDFRKKGALDENIWSRSDRNIFFYLFYIYIFIFLYRDIWFSVASLKRVLVE